MVVLAKRRRAREPGMYEVRVVSPPPRSLGVHVLPVNTQCGDLVSIEESDYVVTTVVAQYRFERGRYVKEHNRCVGLQG